MQINTPNKSQNEDKEKKNIWEHAFKCNFKIQ